LLISDFFHARPNSTPGNQKSKIRNQKFLCVLCVLRRFLFWEKRGAAARMKTIRFKAQNRK
jgi:hypothetical protein